MSAALAALLAVASSASYAVGDVLASRTVRRHTAASVATWVQLCGLLLLFVVAAVFKPQIVGAAMVWGVGGGAVGALGVLFFYTALQNGPTSIVAPISASSVLVPVVAGVVQGETLTWAVAAGLLLVLAGVTTIATAGYPPAPHRLPRPANTPIAYALSPDAPRPPGAPGAWRPAAVHDACKPSAYANPFRTAVVFAVLAALSFGLLFVLVGQATAAASLARTSVPAGDAAGVGQVVMVAIAVQGGSLLVTALAATRHTRACLRPTSGLLKVVGVIAVVDVVGDLLITYALATGPLALVGPLGSLNPVFAVIAAALLFRERLTRRRTFGIVVAFVGVGLVSL